MKANGMSPHVIDNFIELGTVLHNGTLLEGYEQQDVSTVSDVVKLVDFAGRFANIFNKKSVL